MKKLNVTQFMPSCPIETPKGPESGLTVVVPLVL